MVDGGAVLGYHGGLYVNGQLQDYVVADIESSGFFQGSAADVSALSHELAETVNDPSIGNPTPSFLNPVLGVCQTNLEVADPTENTRIVPVTINGAVYHVQELTYFGWFYHKTPSGGAGANFYSTNGTFTSYAPAY